MFHPPQDDPGEPGVRIRGVSKERDAYRAGCRHVGSAYTPLVVWSLEDLRE
jgi:hypothetical protein